MAYLSALVRATGTLTIGAAVPTAADTFTINGRAYTWRAAVGATANEVKIGADVTASAVNAAQAINATPAGSGVNYGSATTANVDVTATSAAGVVTLSARTPGVIGNTCTTTESGTNTVFGAATLTGGSGSSGTALAEVSAEITNHLARNQVNSQSIRDLKALQAEIVASGAS